VLAGRSAACWFLNVGRYRPMQKSALFVRFFCAVFLCLVQVLDEVDRAQCAWGMGLVVMFG
jgi:hypothetical protein